MKIVYDKEADVVYIQLNPTAEIEVTDEFKENLLVDYDGKGKMVGIEITNASKTIGKEVLEEN